MENSSIALGLLIIRLNFSKLGVYIEKQWLSKFAHFLVSVTPEFRFNKFDYKSRSVLRDLLSKFF